MSASDESTPFYFDEVTGEVKVPVAFRRWSTYQRNEKLTALVKLMFADAAHRGDRGKR